MRGPVSGILGGVGGRNFIKSGYLISWGKGHGEVPGSGGHQGRERGRGATGKCPDRRVRGEVFVKSLHVRRGGCMLLTKVIISLTISAQKKIGVRKFVKCPNFLQRS